MSRGIHQTPDMDFSMRLWKRAANLTLSGQKYDLEDFNFSFKVVHEDRPKGGQCDIKIYNLSENTRNAMQKGDPCILNAGYQDDVGVLFAGQILEFNHKKEALDWVTSVTAIDAMSEWMGIHINKTYRGPISAADVLTDVLGVFGLEVQTKELVKNIVYPRQKLCQGKVKDVIREIAVNDCKSRFIVRNGQVIINDPRDGINTGYILSAETGLLSAKSKKATQSVDNEDRPDKQSQEEKENEAPSHEVLHLLRYDIGCADYVSVESKELNGEYLVISLVHEGETKGNKWQSTFAVRGA